VVGAAPLSWNSRRVGILVHKLHVLHEELAGHAELVADGAAARVGSAHQRLVLYRGTVLSSVSSEAALRGEPLAADVAVEGPVLQPLDLALVVAQVLLQVRQLDEGPPALGDVAFVRSLSCVKPGVLLNM